MKNKLWLTNAILDSICKRRSMFKSHFLLRTDTEKAYFRKYSNKLTREIASAKSITMPPPSKTISIILKKCGKQSIVAPP